MKFVTPVTRSAALPVRGENPGVTETDFTFGRSPEDNERLVQMLIGLGADEAQARAEIAAGRGGDFAFELNIRTGPPLTIESAAQAANVETAEFLRYWHALGLATPPPGAAVVPADVVAALPIVSEATETWIGEEAALGIARVIGSTAARIAESLVDAFRMGFEVPRLSAGSRYSDVVQEYVDLTAVALPPFLDFVSAVVKAHLVRVASGAWSPGDDQQAAKRELFVGFADLVGYTALTRTLTPGELAVLLGRFEEHVSDVVTSRGGRLVKLIGDGAMFTCDTAVEGCTVALGVSERLGADDALPPARVGADCGEVLSLYGDYFGDVVNRAARLVALANPGTVVVSETVATAAADRSFGFERLPEQALKGFHAPAVTYRLLPA